MSKEVFTLKQVAQSIRKTLESRYERTYWVKAEIYKMNLFPSGHAFPELVQRTDGKIVANLSGVIWKTNYGRISKQFEATVKEPFSEGKEVLMLVKITFSEVYGLSLHITDIDPSYSLGALHKLKLETIDALNKLGILQKNQSLSLSLPKRIAVISAESSKGLSDFMQVLSASQSQIGISTFLFNATVQGDQAVESILQAFNKIERVRQYFDAVVIVRGGGAEVGMSCYDDFKLCKRIAEFPLPVLCGIGHSTNLTVAEMVAYSHAITPSVLASDLLQEFELKLNELLAICTNLNLVQSKLLTNIKNTFNQTVSKINGVTKWRFERINNQLNTIEQRSIQEAKQILSFHKQYISSSPIAIQTLVKKSHQIEHHRRTMLQQQLTFTMNRMVDKNGTMIESLEKQVQLMSPSAVLARGFSIARSNGKAVLSKTELHPGTMIQIELSDGTAEAEVKST
ncbi:MAG: exodeoxyribonuclease VII large subunit [Flavobacteriales bacterium]|jgi:exodeoxyribonuclease VII large subunit